MRRFAARREGVPRSEASSRGQHSVHVNAQSGVSHAPEMHSRAFSAPCCSSAPPTARAVSSVPQIRGGYGGVELRQWRSHGCQRVFAAADFVVDLEQIESSTSVPSSAESFHHTLCFSEPGKRFLHMCFAAADTDVAEAVDSSDSTVEPKREKKRSRRYKVRGQTLRAE